MKKFCYAQQCADVKVICAAKGSGSRFPEGLITSTNALHTDFHFHIRPSMSSCKCRTRKLRGSRKTNSKDGLRFAKRKKLHSVVPFCSQRGAVGQHEFSRLTKDSTNLGSAASDESH